MQANQWSGWAGTVGSGCTSPSGCAAAGAEVRGSPLGKTAMAAGAVGSLFVPGPEDVAIGAFVATKAGQAVAGALKGKSTAKTVGDLVEGSGLKTTQQSVSGPKVERFTEAMNNGDNFPPIKVDGNTVVDGNHRAVASQISGKPIDTTPGTAPDIPTRPLEELKIDPVDF